ncbi:hypothetical protein fugu_020076 [Takifugu bimaculatus]|uniref:Ig-like domain-containing protein n=1 Tax=Takifugu bimaculatus TaxID=433685 RepID=A0A4Z2BJC8_9TELE|nr:hypothetical protein fugu_020076 [Takifugu bimaculatus]
MPPTVSWGCRRTAGGGATVALLLSLCLGSRPSVATCPMSCLCASDIISCSSGNLSVLPFDLPGYATWLDLSHNALAALQVGWISGSFGRLVTLVLNRNSVRLIGPEAFAAMPRLAHLDLSSNQIKELNSSIFAGLNELKELLLFGNQISQIEPGAFTGLHRLHRFYLSGNRLKNFPLGLFSETGGPRNLSLLDLSYNRLTGLPLQTLLSLAPHIGIYLQGNPLVCDCPLQALLEYWLWKQYEPLVDFQGQYPCLDDSSSECNQSVESNVASVAKTYHVEPGKWLQVPCLGFRGPNITWVFWVTPTAVVNSSASDPNSHFMVFPNGTLEIHSVRLEDSGTYACVAPQGRPYSPSGSREVRVVVGDASRDPAHRSGSEHFNTAFTTLASCVVSIILVLLYLYLTPCRCRDSQGGRRCGGRALVLCSDPREMEAGQRRSNGKRVIFIEPQTEDTGNGVSKSTPMFSGHVATEGILKNGSRTVGQSQSDPAHVPEPEDGT